MHSQLDFFWDEKPNFYPEEKSERIQEGKKSYKRKRPQSGIMKFNE